MKKKIFAVAVIAIYLSLAAWGTYAYFTVDDVAHNIITSGGVEIDIEEWRDVGDGELVEFPDVPILIMPGSEESKIVTVHNLQKPAYVRVRYDYLIYDANGDTMTVAPDVIDEVIVIDTNDTDWTKVGDWYYYNTPLSQDEITTALFTKVTFPAEKLGNEYQKARLIINVTAHAVQVANNGPDVYSAAGWPD